LHDIIFYRDKNGKEPVLEYIKELRENDNKDNRIKLNKINDYIQALSVYGTRLTDNYVKHLDGEIWELRPIRDRILFAGWSEGRFVLLHPFVKKTQKTPKREIIKAKKELRDFIERNDSNGKDKFGRT
jgi:phage-related protein